MKRPDLKSDAPTPLSGFARPSLPAGAKGRILQRARLQANVTAHPTRKTLTDRLWEHRGLRLAWALSAVVLCALQWRLAPPGANAVDLGHAGQGQETIADTAELAPFLRTTWFHRHPPRAPLPRTLEELVRASQPSDSPS